MRLVRDTFAGAILIAAVVAFFYSNQFAVLKLALEFWDPVAISQYRLSITPSWAYEEAIKRAIEEHDFGDAQALIQFAVENGIELSPDLVGRAQESILDFGLRNALDFANGAVVGEVTNLASLGGVIAADYFNVGDARDVLIQGFKLVNGEEYDSFTLGLALVGLYTVVPGTGGPPDLVFSTLKNANKARKISRGLLTQVKKISLRLVDVDALKRGLAGIAVPELKTPSMSSVRRLFADVHWRDVVKGDFTTLQEPILELMPFDVKRAKTAFEGALRKEVKAELNQLASAGSGLVAKGGLPATFRALEHAEDARELGKFAKLAGRMEGKTSAVIRVLGKGAIRLGNLAYQIAAVVAAAVGWILGFLYFSWSVARMICKLSRRASVPG